MNYDFPLVLSFDDVLLVPQKSSVNSRKDVDVSTYITPKLKLSIPLITTNMSTVSGIEMATEMARLGGMSILHRFETIESQVEKVKLLKSKNINFGVSLGVREHSIEHARMLINAGANILVIDAAHGHLKKVTDTIINLRSEFGKDLIIIGGIAATYECARDLYEAGADSINVGVGGGSICTTRVKSGCGLPTFTSILEASKAAKEFNRTVIPLSGIENSGMIVKSLAAGSCAIMGGNIFAGTDECPTPIVEMNGGLYKQYNGSTSYTEKLSHVNNGVNSDKHYTIHVEGVEGFVSYKGSVESVVESLLAGIRSGMSYCGANNISELQKKAVFVRVTAATQKENNYHDIVKRDI